MTLIDVRLRILGRLTNNILLLSEKALHIANLNQSEAVLFCDYSEFEIPIGSKFYTIEDVNSTVIYSGEIVLTNVTQQFMTPLESIPQGWKTICKFKFVEDLIPQVIKNLPEIKEWSESNNFLILK